jgi:hypothetical protein
MNSINISIVRHIDIMLINVCPEPGTGQNLDKLLPRQENRGWSKELANNTMLTNILIG